MGIAIVEQSLSQKIYDIQQRAKQEHPHEFFDWCVSKSALWHFQRLVDYVERAPTFEEFRGERDVHAPLGFVLFYPQHLPVFVDLCLGESVAELRGKTSDIRYSIELKGDT